MRLVARFVSLLLTPVLIIGPLSAQTAPPSPAPPSNVVTSSALQLRLVEGESGEVPAGSRGVTAFVLEAFDSNGVVVPDAAVALRLPDADPTGTFADGTHAAVAYTDQTGRASIPSIQWNATPGVVPIRVTASRGTAHAGILIQQTLTSASMTAVGPRVPQTAAGTFSPSVSLGPLPLAPPFDTQSVAKLTRPSRSVTVTPRLHSVSESQNPEPSVSVTSASPGESKHSSKTKWIILLAAVAAGAGVGVAMMSKKSPTSTAAAPGISIGPPTISIGGR